MRCPKCGHTFLVTDPSKGAGGGPAAKTGAAPVPRQMKQTMVGVGVGVGGFGAAGGKPAPPPPAKPAPAPAPPPAPAAPSFTAAGPGDAFDDGLALPAVKPAPPKPGGPRPQPITNAKPAAPPPPAFPGLDDLDLPALAGDVGLPAAVPPRQTAKSAKAAPVVPVASAPAPAPAPPPFDFDVDLPAVLPATTPARGADLPSPKARGIDLPSPKPRGADLPAPKGFGTLDLPAPKGNADPFGAVDLPAPKAAAQGGFGSIDLPSAQGFGADLPSPRLGADLPAPRGFGTDLPSPKPPFADLPSLQNDLPLVGGGLPVPRVGGGGGFGEIDLPSLQNDLPQSMSVDAHMPMPMSDDRLLPNRQGPPPAPIAFGELDLPLVGGIGASPPMMPPPVHGGSPVSFGELDLPSGPLDEPMPPSGMGGMGAGGMAFGEVDLGGDPNGAPVLGPPPATSAGSFAFQEASLAPSQPPAATTGKRPAEAKPDKPPSKAPKILAACAALIVVGGAALQFTPLGAYGHIAISDKLRAGEYAKNATTAADAARKKLALDTYASAVEAADELAELRKKSPRSRPLAAYAAFVEFASQARFGGDSGRAARAKTFLNDMPTDSEVAYLVAARAAEVAASGEWSKAKPLIDQAIAKEPKDGIQQDLAALRGQVALMLKDAKTAQEAYTDALNKGGPSARAHWGLAQTFLLTKNLPKAKEAVDAALKLSPTHTGARTLHALLTWQLGRDDATAVKELDAILEEKSKKGLGPSELSSALSAKGQVMLERDRASEARAAFDEAVKIDPRNVAALVGQGQVLYADGRFTEALTRFDEAVAKDPTNSSAILGAAMTKIALERLADAKTELVAARQAAPKDMGIALWLAKTEEALGNKQGAEQLYAAAVDLADPQNVDAIQAYSALAAFLASQGRTAEAQAKLDQARQKLPDSAALQRAFGDVAAAQGHFDEAVSHFESALQRNPNDLSTRFRLGVTYRKMRKLDLAAAQFDQIAAIDKEYPNIALERGQLFELSGDVQKALEQFQSALQKAPKDIDLKLRVGAAFVIVGKADEALPMLTEVKNVRPNSAEANHFIGRAYLKQGGLEAASAMRFLQRAVELDPNRAEYHLYVAWAANEASPAQLGLARTHVEKALALDKLLADGYWQRGVVEMREGAVNDAIKDLHRALELKPARTEAHATLAETYEQKNDLGTAMSEWSKAIAADDKQPAWRYRYGRLLLEKGNAGEAAKHLAYAVEQGKTAQPRPGWLGPAAFEAGEALRKTGQKQPAVDAYTLYLELAAPTAPDRRDAIKALKDLGAAYEPGR
ncbi:hypothetical protein AKJ09_06114 [Labilithrix luteola]|uniref:Uncharacterized protein n=2 Tax=Labilithrix luteola TaxID=1391654 RepID=A0A0K1Q0Z1_9BACT|nr:hypothetical protein AKJ09_06114 [Labilithrix luteola]